MLTGFTSNPSIPFMGCRFFEIGVNLLDSQFQGVYNGKQKHAEDILDVMQRADSMGVKRSIITAGNLEESINALKLARLMNSKGYSLYSTVGCHPTRANELQDDVEADKIIEKYRELILDGLTDGKVLALGECGLDYDRLHFCSKEVQINGFKRQLNLAAEVSLPLFLHNRNTDGDFLRIVTEERSKMTRGGVVHSFDGTMEEMIALTELGLYIGINGCSLKTEENLRVITEIPEHLLLLETDAPWCGIKPSHASSKFIKSEFPKRKPEKYEVGFLVKDRNEPCMIGQVLEVVAAVRQQDPVELAETVYRNSERLFFPNL